jgi:hypothetical protein
MKTPKEIIIETLQGEGLMYAYRDFADDIKDEHIEKIADKIVKNLNIPAVINRRELLIDFINKLLKQKKIIYVINQDNDKIVDEYLKSINSL